MWFLHPADIDAPTKVEGWPFDESKNIPAVGEDVEKHEVFANSNSDIKGPWLKKCWQMP